jgi:hypothetical protein
MACNNDRACGVLTVQDEDVGNVLMAEDLARPYAIHAHGGSHGVRSSRNRQIKMNRQTPDETNVAPLLLAPHLRVRGDAELLLTM